jgi:short-subunit dehydrogenase
MALKSPAWKASYRRRREQVLFFFGYASQMSRTAITYLWSLAILVQLGGCATSLRPSDEAAIGARTFVVTGASSGFGRGVALELGGHGANVVLAARRTELLEALADEISNMGGTPLVVTTDVSDPDEVNRLAEAALAQFGRIDVWINNAGVTAIGRFWDVPVEDHGRLMDVNLKGALYGSHAALRQFREQGAGTLVNIGSVVSHVPTANHASYSASKAALLSLGRALNEELRLSGHKSIKVATVLPWAADTPIWDHAANYSGSALHFAPMDDPRDVIRAIVRVSLYPREELPVGWRARGVRLAHRIFPGFSKQIASNVYQSQLEAAPSAPPTSGALHDPMPGTGRIDGGIRQRMEEGNAGN